MCVWYIIKNHARYTFGERKVWLNIRKLQNTLRLWSSELPLSIINKFTFPIFIDTKFEAILFIESKISWYCNHRGRPLRKQKKQNSDTSKLSKLSSYFSSNNSFFLDWNKFFFMGKIIVDWTNMLTKLTLLTLF